MKYQSTIYQICLVLALSAVVTLWMVYTVGIKVKNMKVQYYEFLKALKFELKNYFETVHI
jgi:hypothetical protein